MTLEGVAMLPPSLKGFSMLMFNCELKFEDEKTGLYAQELITKGSVIWKYANLTCHVFWKKQFLAHCDQLPLNEIRELLTYSYIKNGLIYFPTDKSKYKTHSLGPNTAMRDENTAVATKDILFGERLTENYRLSYDRDNFYFWEELKEKLNREQILKLIYKKLSVKGRPKSSLHI